MKLFLKACLVAASAGLMATSCSDYKDDTPDNFPEAEKNLSGVWKLSSVTRNTVDITEAMDFSQFRLHLNGNGSYSLENPMPFPVGNEGKWEVDDPQHPYTLYFTESDALGKVEVEINYPIILGERKLSITHSPGCGSNSYVYLFERVK